MNSLFSIWNNEKYRGYLYQAFVLGLVAYGSYFLYSNAAYNLEQQKIASGFGFLEQEAKFDIGELPIEYDSTHTYAKALLVGAINTVKVSFYGILYSMLIGLLIAMMRMSSNWLVSKIAYWYTEIARNTPLLLQLIFVYSFVTFSFPIAKEVEPIYGNIFFTNRGLFYPKMDSTFAWDYLTLILLSGVFVAYVIGKIFKRYHEKTGNYIPSGYLYFLLPTVFFLTAWLLDGRPTAYTIPEFSGFNFQGGNYISPEFLALITGLVFHTSSYIAEVIRSGIESVGKGQLEAANSIGLRPKQIMTLVVLPQAMRIIVPPLTNQMLNLTKNSTLAVGVGYPDFVSVANTTINQTGQAIEGIALIMGLYMFFSVTTSIFMNWFNKKVALVER